MRPDIINPANQGQYKYFYHSVDAVKAGMESALKMLAESKAARIEAAQAAAKEAQESAAKDTEQITDETSEL
jgi:hypothetical protein